jgi:hypothetical protein
MKMIRNKNEVVSTRPLLVLLIDPLLMGALRRTCTSAGEALSESISLRFGTLRCPTISAQELAQLAGPTHSWLRALATITVCGLRSRSRFPCKRANTTSGGAA